jgi:two-component system cell cycle sensor histidine kinase/response regulator CckA
MSTQHPDVLIVDDDDLMRDLAIAAVNKLGYVAVGRSDANGALEIVKTVPSIQVVLSDICLERGTGPEWVRKALRERPEIKVVFMTGGFSNVSFRRTDPVLTKPFALDRLKEALDSVLNQPQPAFEPRPTVLERRRL